MPDPVAGAVQGAAETVLVVDDNEAKCYVLSRWLARAGHRVLTAATGMEALAVVEESRPDLVILDVHLPDISGIVQQPYDFSAIFQQFDLIV